MSTQPNPVASPPRRPEGSTPWREIAPYALASLVSFTAGLGILVLILWKAQVLVKLGLIGNLYYIVLLPLALSAAAFLFGILRSTALYRGEVYGGALELGGPAVVFVAVLILGFKLPSPQTPFNLTVFVQEEKEGKNLALKTAGYVVIDIGPDRRVEQIGAKGDAYFPGIPANFRGENARIWVDSDTFEVADASKEYSLGETSLYVDVRRKERKVFGRVQDARGNSLAGVEIRVAHLTATTDKLGEFEVTIPGDRMAEEFDLEAVAPGFEATRSVVVPNSKAVISLPRKR
jgi:hypothetical protein